MCPCHCQDTASINKQLDSIAEMVAVELLKKKGKAEEGGEEEDTEAGISAPKRPRQQTAVAEMVEKGLSADVILPALNSVLYGQLGFKGAGSDSYYQLENSYIDKVWVDHQPVGASTHVINIALRLLRRCWRGRRGSP